MTRIVITGGPKTGKTTLANHLALGGTFTDGRTGPGRTRGPGMKAVRHTDDLIHLGWSEASQAASLWFNEPGPWIIEGVAAVRALRKWHAQHAFQPPPADRVIFLTETFEEPTPGQRAMAKSCETMLRDIEPWLAEHGVRIEFLVQRNLRCEHPGYNGIAKLE